MLRICDLDEAGLLARIFPLLPQGTRDNVVLGPGDDCAVLAAPDGRFVVTTDILVEGQHFRRDWSTGSDVGWRAAMQNLADVAAMGARPTSLVVGLGLPPQLPVAWLEDFARGLALACQPMKVAVVGGDLCAADSLLVSVTAHGLLDGRAPLLRSGARAGDTLAHAGFLGHSAAGLALLTAGLANRTSSPCHTSNPGDASRQPHACRQSQASQCDPTPFVAAHLRPQPPLTLGPAAAQGGATSMMDVSDGLLLDAQRMAAASGVCINLSTDALRAAHQGVQPAMLALAQGTPSKRQAQAEPPCPEHCDNSAEHCDNSAEHCDNSAEHCDNSAEHCDSSPENGPDHSGVHTLGDLAWDWVLSGGEDHGLLASFPPTVPLPAGFTAIGRVLACDPTGAGSAQSVATNSIMTLTSGSAGSVLLDGRPPTGHMGWDHFSPGSRSQ